jgi:hypothetical protein
MCVFITLMLFVQVKVTNSDNYYSSLLRCGINYGRKKFYGTEIPESCTIKYDNRK